jgi:hypothetical protein
MDSNVFWHFFQRVGTNGDVFQQQQLNARRRSGTAAFLLLGACLMLAFLTFMIYCVILSSLASHTPMRVSGGVTPDGQVVSTAHI